MFVLSVDGAFRRFKQSGDPRALAAVFDATAPELLGLARHLAGPDSTAEDLLQSTFLTAIESRARYDGEQRVLPWLAGILANHAREARRRQRRVHEPERLRAEVGVDPSDEASASELRATLERAIAALPEAQRSVLRLYLQHGLEPAEIAHSLERPPGTVRAQLSRGLERLRARLPKGLVSVPSFALVAQERLAEIRTSLLAQCGGASVPAASSTILLGVMTMSLNKKLLAIAAVLLALLVPFVLLRDPELESASSGDVAGKSAELQDPSSAPSGSDDVPQPERSVARAEEKSAEPPAVEPPRWGSLRVKLVRPDGAPLPAAGVAIRTSVELQRPGTLLRFVPTDEQGSVTFEDLPPGQYTVELDRATFVAAAEVKLGKQKELTVKVRGVRVEGFVLDGSGAPVPGATIWAHSHRVESAQVARTDALGAFQIEAVTPQMLLQARMSGFAPSRAEFVIGEEGANIELRLVLEDRGWPLTGRVLDPEGKPVAGAMVAVVPQSAANATPYDRGPPQTRTMQMHTDGRGAFSSDEVPCGAVIVTAAGHDPRWTPDSRRIEVGSGAAHVDLILRVGAKIEGRITDDGKPVGGCSIFVFCSQPEMPVSYLFNVLASRNAETDGDGRYSMVGILAGQVEIHAVRNGLEVIGKRREQISEGKTARWDLDCSAANSLALEVTVEPPQPPVGAPNWLVVLRPQNEVSTGLATQMTDASGTAHFPRLSNRRYVAMVYCRPEDGRLLELASREFDPREQRLLVQIPAERLRFQPLRGRLVDARGTPRPNCNVMLRRNESEVKFDVQRATDGDGGFTFENLLPGKYVLEARDGSVMRRVRECSVVGDRPEDLGDVAMP